MHDSTRRLLDDLDHLDPVRILFHCGGSITGRFVGLHRCDDEHWYICLRRGKVSTVFLCETRQISTVRRLRRKVKGDDT